MGFRTAPDDWSWELHPQAIRSQLEAVDLQNQFRLAHNGLTVSSIRPKKSPITLQPRPAVPE